MTSSSSSKSTTTTTTPVQVYILMGQSNMWGFGQVHGQKPGQLEYAVHEKGLYPYLIDDHGQWARRRNVRNVRVQGLDYPNGRFNVTRNHWLWVIGNWIGPEFGIGHVLSSGSSTTMEMEEETPILLLKSCIGNRALGWDLLPPGSPRFEYTDRRSNTTFVYAGYHDALPHWEKGNDPPPSAGAGGGTDTTINNHNNTGDEEKEEDFWYAGLQYDLDVYAAKQVLQSIGDYYPGATEYVIKGFFWWQGDRDSKSYVYSSRYETNLVRLIQQLRTDFDAPEAKFVTASLGQTKKGSPSNGGMILNAMMAVDGRSHKYPEFQNNVAHVYTYWLNPAKGGSSQHYNLNAETFMNVGEAMGDAMLRLLRTPKRAPQRSRDQRKKKNNNHHKQ